MAKISGCLGAILIGVGACFDWVSLAEETVAYPCNVVIEFGQAWVPNMYTNGGAKMKAEVNWQLAGALHDRFSYWEFEGGTTNYPRVLLRLEIGEAWTVAAQMIPAAQGGAHGNWSETLYSPGDLQDLDRSLLKQSLPGDIIRCFQEEILTRNEQSMREALQQFVPLVSTEVNPPHAPLLSTNTTTLAVLPLSWEKYKGLAKSKFRIECSLPGQGVINILSKGRSKCLKHPGNPALTCLVVEYEAWERDAVSAHASELPILVPKRFYLSEYEFVTSFECDELAPQIVPERPL